VDTLELAGGSPAPGAGFAVSSAERQRARVARGRGPTAWVPRVTQGTEFPDERVRRTCATSQAVACSEPRCSLVNFSEGVKKKVPDTFAAVTA
jgi:hypothetical protein